jgi:hypothetical protein
LNEVPIAEIICAPRMLEIASSREIVANHFCVPLASVRAPA